MTPSSCEVCVRPVSRRSDRTWPGVSVAAAFWAFAPLSSAATAAATVALALEVPSKQEVYARSSAPPRPSP